MPRRIVRRRDKLPTEFANLPEVIEADRAALAGPTGREEGRALDEPLSDFEAEVLSHPEGGMPAGDRDGLVEGGTPDETADGLNDTEEMVRHEAEDRSLSSRSRGVDGRTDKPG